MTPRLSAARAIVLGTLVVGILDGLDAIVFFYLWSGVAPPRIFQGIAAGLLGRSAAVQGGASTALLGVALHFLVAFGVVTTFVAASRRLEVLTRRPVVSGILYGLAVYAVMNHIVIPLSAIGPRTTATPLPVLANGLLIHVLGVGLPAALFARAAARGPQAEIEQMKKTLASMPPEQRKAVEDAIKMMEDMQQDPQIRKLQKDAAKMMQKASADEHQRDVAKWKETHPENPNVLVARRLRTFLDVSADVDFSAKLAPSGRATKFADAKYEKKSSEWKLCYRAGPEAVAAARAAAAAWLKEIAPK